MRLFIASIFSEDTNVGLRPTTHRMFFRAQRLTGEVNPPYAGSEKTLSRSKLRTALPRSVRNLLIENNLFFICVVNQLVTNHSPRSER